MTLLPAQSLHMPRIPCLFLMALPLLSQAPDAAFFKGDPKAILQLAAEKARSLDPRDPDTLSVTAQGYLALGERTKAEDLFLTMEHRSASIKTYGQIARAWLADGLQDPVLPLVAKAKAEPPKDGSDLADFAIILMDGGMPKEAGDLMALAATADPKNCDGFMGFARACLRAGRRDDALPWLQRAILVKPRDPDTWRDAATALADRGLEH